MKKSSFFSSIDLCLCYHSSQDLSSDSCTMGALGNFSYLTHAFSFEDALDKKKIEITSRKTLFASYLRYSVHFMHIRVDISESYVGFCSAAAPLDSEKSSSLLRKMHFILHDCEYSTNSRTKNTRRDASETFLFPCYV